MPTIERILCPTDLGGQSRRALEHALVLARRCRAGIEILHVVDPAREARVAPIPFGEPIVVVAVEPYATEELRERAKDLAAVAWDEGVFARPVLREGPIARTVIDEARSMPADIIVMGTHGHGALRAAVLGSVTADVVRGAPCPVLTVRHAPHGGGLADSAPAFSRVLCPVDFSEPSLAALDYGAWLADSSGADLGVVHVVEWPSGVLETSVARELDTPVREDDVRAAVLARLGGALRSRTSVMVPHGDARGQILCAAEEWGARVIVMGVHGRGVIDRALFGSTTDHVIRRAPCPVLTLRTLPAERGRAHGGRTAA
jgi:nucleotide-binding universal stress UspA family protein